MGLSERASPMRRELGDRPLNQHHASDGACLRRTRICGDRVAWCCGSKRSPTVEAVQKQPFSLRSDGTSRRERAAASTGLWFNSRGPGYRHVVTPEEIRERLARRRRDPATAGGGAAEPLDPEEEALPLLRHAVGQCRSTCTRCPTDLVEHFLRPATASRSGPKRHVRGPLGTGQDGEWQLIWTEQSDQGLLPEQHPLPRNGPLVRRSQSSAIRTANVMRSGSLIRYGYRARRAEPVRCRAPAGMSSTPRIIGEVAAGPTLALWLCPSPCIISAAQIRLSARYPSTQRNSPPFLMSSIFVSKFRIRVR